MLNTNQSVRKMPIAAMCSGTALALITFVAYYDTFVWLYGRYTAADTYYSHGFLIPVISLYFVWQMRDELKSLPVQPSKLGLLILCFALFINMIGIMVNFYFVTGISFFFYLVGLILFLFGSQVTRKVLFPLIFILFMIPLPMQLIGAILYPMKVIVLEVSVVIIRMINIPVYVEGFNVHVSTGVVEIGNPCSGLRSLIAFLAMGAIIGYLYARTKAKWALIIIATIPIAFLANISRTIFLILIAVFFGLEYSSPDYWLHDASGIAVFAIGFALLVGVVKVTQWRKN